MDTHGVDYAIFVVILVVSIGIGFFHAWRAGKKKENTTNEFLMGDRTMGTVPVAVSIFASVISGTIFLGYPVEMYTRGTQFAIGAVGLFLSWLFSAVTFVPLFYRLRVISVFEVSNELDVLGQGHSAIFHEGPAFLCLVPQGQLQTLLVNRNIV